jgi:prevent-host-death family protein
MGTTTLKTVSAAEANRRFSALLRDVARGARITVTSRGRPVATITAADESDRKERAAARRALLARLRAIPATGSRAWTRDELYD